MKDKWFKKYFLEQYFETYCSGIFSDELDKLGFRHQVISGWAMKQPKIKDVWSRTNCYIRDNRDE